MNATLCASLMIFKRGHQGVSCRSSTCNISNIQIFIYLYVIYVFLFMIFFHIYIYIYEYIWSFSVFNKLCANPSSRRTEQSQEFMVAISNAIVLRLHMIEQSRGKHPLRSWFGESYTCICTYIYIYHHHHHHYSDNLLLPLSLLLSALSMFFSLDCKY